MNEGRAKLVNSHVNVIISSAIVKIFLLPMLTIFDKYPFLLVKSTRGLDMSSPYKNTGGSFRTGVT